MIRKIVSQVVSWCDFRGLNKTKPERQLVKLDEEVAELKQAIEDNDIVEIIDAVGDIQVVLIILCRQLNLDYDGCLHAAYKEIKDRTGKTVDGIFIKDTKDE